MVDSRHRPRKLIYNVIMSINPEKNLKVRAILYVIGVGGLIHLTSLLILAISKQDLNYFNPLYTVDIDQLWKGINDNYLIYAGGWIAFALAIFFVYKILDNAHNKD